LATLLVSDVHLSAERPERIGEFLEFLTTTARRAEALYLLGDVFDLWLGDDDLGPPNGEAVCALAALRRAGVGLFAQHGNHDFLLGRRFERDTGCRLLPDPVTVDLYGERVLLSHGDRFCTDDTGYQRWRAFTRSRLVQTLFRTLPLALRRAQAIRIRTRTRALTRRKPVEIMDVNLGAIAAAMRTHGVRRLVHGHTHRPGVYPLEVDGVPAERIVLGDWYEQDSVLVWDETGPCLHRVRDALL
jgi:UDP-2,3-diacylglucosamine hydrolase